MERRKAKWENGVLKLDKPLDLPEGSECDCHHRAYHCILARHPKACPARQCEFTAQRWRNLG
jgi:predicted DNA-binding antitoxin AbrB/MazE fold protein